MPLCVQCPRRCGADRSASAGFCSSPEEFLVARIGLHPWEEPILSGERGAGTVFFSGCNLRCVYCQNRAISRGGIGTPMSADALAEAILGLRDAGAACIDLVTPTHYTDQLIPVLRAVKPSLGIPIVWNCGGYESVASLRSLEGLIDVYLPDCKYFDGDLASALSAAPDYFPVFCDALSEMLRQVGSPTFSAKGSLASGVIVRHLVLPSHRADSIALLRALADRFGVSRFLLSLMNQYTPDFAATAPDPALHRRLTTFEYDSVLSVAASLGFRGFSQSRAAASADFTPDFENRTETDETVCP